MDIVVSHLCKTFGDKTVLCDVSCLFPARRITCVMGPSGVGKTTLLRCIAHLETPDSGRISGTGVRPAFMFQEDRLCDAFSAVANIRLVTGRAVTDDTILLHLSQLGLSDAARKPVRELSGGMRRRVAIARAVLYGGDVLLLDEPFKGLDAALRQAVMDYLLQHTVRRTVLLVTHDAAEAQYLGADIITL